MSLKRFVAASAREALSAVRRELGEGAVVLANRSVREGVEITAMASDEIDAVVELAAPAIALARESTAAPAHPLPPPPPRDEPFAAFVRRTSPAQESASTAGFLRTRTQRSAAAAAEPAPVPAAGPARTPFAPPAAAIAPAGPREAASGPDPRLLAEIQAMKAALGDQIAAFAWSDAARRHPLQARLAGELLAAGFSPALARSLLEHLPSDFADDEARRWMLAALVRNLASFGEGRFLDAGGVFALVGPTGVGKTTTTAKLAARYAMRYGADAVGLVTTDSYRIGAHDQLKIYGRILGIPVQLARGGMLASVLGTMQRKKVVLIDTVGMGQRDPRVREQMQEIASVGARRVLLLNAACQGETLDEVIRIYRRFGVDGAILTKIDEAVRLGGALDGAVRHGLGLAFITNGQRVPEDLHLAQSAFLVQRALRAAASPAFELRDEEPGLRFAHAARPAFAERDHAA